MKKLMVLLLALMISITGCAGVTPGINVDVATNVATDVAFVLVLQNNPSYKAEVVAGLNTVKTYLAGSVTYDDLILLISKQFGGKYAVVGVILMDYFNADTPIFESNLPLLETYKAAVIKKVDRLILLANSM